VDTRTLYTPDVCILINSALQDRNAKKLFNKIEENEFRGLLLETIQKRLDIWLFKLTPDVSAFFFYCKQTRADPKRCLKQIENMEKPKDKNMKRFKRYSNVIKNMLNNKLNQNDLKDVHKNLRQYFNSKYFIFMKTPHIHFLDQTDKDYKATIFEELKKETNGKFYDEEDSEHLALLNYFLQSKQYEISFITADKKLEAFSNDIKNWNKHICIILTENLF